MKYLITILEILMVAGLGKTTLCEARDSVDNLPTFSTNSTPRIVQKLPYVYTKWKHFTVKDGLPNDHIFAIKADGEKVWVGTEDGLVRIDCY